MIKTKKINYIVKFFYLICLLILFSNCGRKPRNIFLFDEQKYTFRINRLSFPAVKNLRLDTTKNRLCWDAITQTKIELTPQTTKKCQDKGNKPRSKFIGYNVYRFAHIAFIPNDPRNLKPIKKTHYKVKPSKKYRWCYVVMGVFECQGRRFEGPTSQIICDKSK